MQPLRAPERPVSHYRNGRLRTEADLPAAENRGGGQPYAGATAPATAFDRLAALMRGQPSPPVAPPVAPPAVPPVAATAAPLAAPRPDMDLPQAALPAETLAEPRPEPRDDPAPTFVSVRRSQPPLPQHAIVRPAAPQVAPGSRAFTQRGGASPRRAQGGDPSPSRLAYRMERLWLTPGFRIFMRYGLPVLVVAVLAGGYLASDSRRAALAGQFTALRDRIENRPEFMVKMMSIDGASAPVADAIRAMVPAELPVSSFKLDLDGFRDTIAAMDAVADVSVKLKAGGVLGVAVTERKPAILWRTETGLEMLDATGHRVATLLERAARPDLPVVAGAGAPDAVPEALAILSAARPILPHVRGMVRMGGRRWDIVLDRGQRILLPEDHAVDAVEEVIALDKAEDLLARDLTAIDLRNSERPTLRLTAAAEAVLRDATQSEAKVTGQ